MTSLSPASRQGGKAPTKGCTGQLDAGKRIKEGYTACSADHVFFTAAPT